MEARARTSIRLLCASVPVLLAVVAACGSEAGSTDPGGTSGSSGTTGGLIGNGGDGGSSGSSGGKACATATKKAEKLPVDMLIGLDTSLSMDFDDKWLNVRAALKTFVSNPAYADLGVGLQFFPARRQCNVGDYESPAVPLTLQPQAVAPIHEALDLQRMAGGTPMVPLLDGLVKYLVTNAKTGRKPVLVLATDGVPDDTCLSAEDGATPNTLENAVAIADRAFKGTPSIATFVIGVGGELAQLNQIAAAGGTTAATLVDNGGSAQQALLAALDGIRKQSIPCDYDIPAGTIDPKATNVTYTTGGAPRDLRFVGNEAGCVRAPDDGWYFDNEAAPKKVILCKNVCEVVKLDDKGSVDLLFGCPRNDVK